MKIISFVVLRTLKNVLSCLGWFHWEDYPESWGRSFEEDKLCFTDTIIQCCKHQETSFIHLSCLWMKISLFPWTTVLLLTVSERFEDCGYTVISWDERTCHAVLAGSALKALVPLLCVWLWVKRSWSATLGWFVSCCRGRERHEHMRKESETAVKVSSLGPLMPGPLKSSCSFFFLWWITAFMPQCWILFH